MDPPAPAVLCAVASGPAGIDAIAERLRSARRPIVRAIDRLVETGLATIDGERVTLADGVTYTADTIDRLTPSPYTVHVRDVVASTNAWAVELLEGDEERVVAVAERQRAGKGRRDRAWRSPRGGIWASLGDGRPLPAATGWVEGLALALATTEAALALGVDAGLKWPNDVVVDDDKLAGILVESTTAERRIRTITGVGLNANVDVTALPPRATSLRALTGPVTRAPVLGYIVHRFEARRGDPDATVRAWRRRCDTIGRAVVVEGDESTIRGTAVGLTADGALRVETDGDTVEIRPERCRRLRHR